MRRQIDTVWRALLGVCVLVGVSLSEARGQNELLLPYTSPIFQSTWANAAVRPEHRFSVSIAPLSSLEFGLTNNAFQLSSVWKKVDGRRLIITKDLLDQVSKNKDHLLHAETQIDIAHFRMMWRDWNFWLGIRNVTNASLYYPTTIYELAIKGNYQYVGKTLSIKGMQGDATNYHEISVGASKMLEEWVFGGRVSLLAGVSNMHMEPSTINLTISDAQSSLYHHHVTGNGKVYMSGIPQDEKGIPSPRHFSAARMKFVNFGNPGMSLSGAVSWKPEKNTTLTFSFNDLGFIHWGDGLATADLKDVDYNFTRVADLGEMLYNRRFKWPRFQDKIWEILQVDSAQLRNGKAYTTMLSPRFHLLGTYRVARQSLVGGSLSAIVHQGHFYGGVTVSFQQSYSNLIHAQVALSYHQRSPLNLGFGVVFTPGPVQMYLVSDNVLGLAMPSLMRTANVRMGVNFVFGPLFENHKLSHR